MLCVIDRFLLKYSSRDEVELLEKGNGGIVEIRNAIAGFEEESPLYGFLRYRRRNVIVKYLPEDCSRLIQGWFSLLLMSLFPSFGSAVICVANHHRMLTVADY